MMRRGLAIGALLVLAGCGTSEPPAKETVPEAKASRAAAPALPTPAAPAPVAEPAREARINLGPDALTVVLAGGATRHVAFDTSHDSTLQILGAALGTPIEQARNDECGAGPLDYAVFRGGLSLYFREGRFAGWDLDGRDAGGAVTVANGLGIGATRRQLEAAGDVTVRETTLGHEFALGNLNGLLDSNAAGGKVTNLWAGTTCSFR